MARPSRVVPLVRLMKLMSLMNLKRPKSLRRLFRVLRSPGVILLMGAMLVIAPARAADDSLFQALGGDEGVARISAGLVERAYADERIKHLFQETNPRFLTEQLRKQFCELSGGPCKYDGETMKNSHAKLGINKAHFNALVEDLQLAMDAQGVPFAAQNRLLALLAPMYRDVVTR
ncbi:group 1 truncated hemoglobin [Roseateles sp. SL47]|uniref:group I truncated hemoglobin n=1 Tax=Roseateles sp. SL47 TaxID=2995138 RepID=UPI002271BC75|nr:group 1 truncated hemoglobin [Roseateles sp. SL47]WAC74438.1 group 1 truncated hemoglobin [Roseateles sp. SL47]